MWQAGQWEKLRKRGPDSGNFVIVFTSVWRFIPWYLKEGKIEKKKITVTPLTGWVGQENTIDHYTHLVSKHMRKVKILNYWEKYQIIQKMVLILRCLCFSCFRFVLVVWATIYQSSIICQVQIIQFQCHTNFTD